MSVISPLRLGMADAAPSTCGKSREDLFMYLARISPQLQLYYAMGRVLFHKLRLLLDVTGDEFAE